MNNYPKKKLRKTNGVDTRAKNKLKNLKIDKEVNDMEKRIVDYAPKPGTNLFYVPKPKDKLDYVGVDTFSKLPISQLTLKGLEEAQFLEMTSIQKASLPHALAGRDILAAAKTGSGKTLAFLIPVIEKLYRLKWCELDGLGALIISPTRELAIQIFEEIKKVGKHHSLSGGVLLGGKKLLEEKKDVNSMNILIATPGRLLQHMHETIGFETINLKVLVLDEADRILDMGFLKTMDEILDNIPKERQTLLFSATQTKNINDLARLSLLDPEYIAIDKESTFATPESLKQYYVTCELGDKIMVLWSFIKSHPKSKILVFLSTCVQVRFMYESFRKLFENRRFGCLHGHQKQGMRMEVYYEFCKSNCMVLFATDVAARGLDIPVIDWVVQLDCPEDTDAYIHRVGRTARYISGGKALLILVPSELEMVKKLIEKKIPIEKIKMKESKLQSPTFAFQSLLTKSTRIKECAQKAVLQYLKSIALQPDKSVFSLESLPLEEFAKSFGLATLPASRALKRLIKKIKKEESKENEEGNSAVSKKEDFLLKTDSEQEEEIIDGNICNNKKENITKFEVEEEVGVSQEIEKSEAKLSGEIKERHEWLKSLKKNLREKTEEDRKFFKDVRREKIQKRKRREREDDNQIGGVILASESETEGSGVSKS